MPAEQNGLSGFLRQVPLLVQALGGLALLMWLPAAHASSRNDDATARGFFYSGLVLLVLVAMLAIATRKADRRATAQGQLAALTGAYLVLPVAAMLPMAVVIRDTSLINLWFEMISCFTTTGATLYEPGRLAPSLHLWRGLIGWLGGFYVLLAAWAVLAPLNLGGAEVISGMMPGQSAGSLRGGRYAEPRERLARAAAALLPVYAGLTLALWVALLMAGEQGLVALVHAMGVLSTSGISVTGGAAVFASGFAGEVLMFFFLLIALSRRLMPLPLPGHRSGRLREDPELRLGFLLIALTTAVLVLRHLISDVAAGEEESLAELARAFWGALFTAASFLTTTGFESAWWLTARDWAGLGAPGLLLMGLAMTGGGVATTAGGLTLLRVQALWQQSRRELERIIHPHSVGSGPSARKIAQEGARLAWVFFMLFAISVGGVLAALTLVGVDFESAMVLGVAALTTTGPLAAAAGPEPVEWAPLSPLVKLILGLAMVVGRLEALALIALLAPGNWLSRWRG